MGSLTGDAVAAANAAAAIYAAAIAAAAASGTQYTEGDTDATITGTAILWEDTGNALSPISAAKPLPVSVLGGGIVGASTIGQRGVGLTAVANTKLLDPAATRVSLRIRNDSNVDLYVRWGASAVSTTNYDVKLPSGGTLWDEPTWKGQAQYLLSGAPTGDVSFVEFLP